LTRSQPQSKRRVRADDRGNARLDAASPRDHVPPVHLGVVVTSLVGAGAVMLYRVRETTRPIDARKILIPPLGMATGLCMFAAPQMRVPLHWGIGAFLFGAIVLSPILVATSRLSSDGEHVRLQRSKAFLFILVGLVIVRLAARQWVETKLDTFRTGALFYLLAFGMIVVWRARMYLAYRALVQSGN
jgi:membrane protein CcdC involved in cytochrome C biogenesis